MRTMHAHTCTHTQETKCWYNPEVVREGRQYRQKHLFRVLKRERVQTGQRNTMAGCYEIGWDVYVWEETHSFWWGGGGGMKPRLLFYLPFQKSLQKLNCIFKISLEILFPFSQPLTVALDIRIYKLLLRMIQPQSQVFFFFFKLWLCRWEQWSSFLSYILSNIYLLVCKAVHLLMHTLWIILWYPQQLGFMQSLNISFHLFNTCSQLPAGRAGFVITAASWFLMQKPPSPDHYHLKAPSRLECLQKRFLKCSIVISIST